MHDSSKNYQELIAENALLKQRIQDLEDSEAQRIHAEEALKESEASYRQLFDNSPAAVYRYDFRSGRFLTANDVFLKYLGYSHDELTSISPYDILTEESKKLFLKRMEKRALGEEVPDTVEYEIIDKNGAQRYVQAHNKNIYDAEGHLVATDVVAHDITERKRAEDALRDREQQLSMIINRFPGRVAQIDRDFRFRFINNQFERVYGLTPDKVLGHTVAEVLGDEIFQQLRPAMEQALNGEMVTVESKVKNFAGDTLQGLNTYMPDLGPDRTVRGFIAVILDVTERKQSEKRIRESEANYRGIIENIVDVYFRSDLQGTLMMISPSGVTLLGYDSESDFIGRDIYAHFFYNPEEGRKVVSDFQEKGTIKDFEVTLRHKDGYPIPVEMSSRYFRDEQGNALGVEGILRDIRKRKQADEEKRILEERLKHADKMEAIGTLAGGIAHDFNNILSAMMGYSELCLGAVKDRPKVYHNVEQVLKAAERAKDLVRQILTFSRKVDHEKKPIAVSPIIKEVVKFIRASLPSTIEIRQTIEESSDVIMADPTQIHQVLMNLCTNAGHAMKESEGILEIGLKEVVMEAGDLSPNTPLIVGHYLELSVRDTGHGIAHENLGRIFDPYFTTKEKGEGTGLGLAVVHGIVEDHGGEIRVDSEEGRGTIFRIYLPVIEEKAEEEIFMPEVVFRGRGETILFIDDEKMLVDLNREMLEELGYRVVAETDPGHAIEVFKENGGHFDIVITDKIMPRMTGFDVAREIKMIRPDTPVLICSGILEQKDMEKFMVLGIRQFISKPIRISTMAKAIRDELDLNNPFYL